MSKTPRSIEARCARSPGRPLAADAGHARAALLASAQQLMAEKGYPLLTVREVAERAGVQPGLVNYHFGGKAGLLRSVVGAVSEQMQEQVEHVVAADGSFEERVRALIRGIVAALNAAPYAPRLIVEQILFADEEVIGEFIEHFARPHLAAIASLLDDGVRSGAIRRVDPRIMAPSMIGPCVFFFLSAPVIRRIFEVSEIDSELADTFASFLSEMILHGVSTRNGATT